MKVMPVFASLILSLFALGAPCAHAAAEDPIKIDIPSMPLGKALKALADQGNFQIVFAADAVKNFNAPRVEGKMRPEEALITLLAGTPLAYVRVADAYVIKTPGATAKPAPATGAGVNTPVESELRLAQSEAAAPVPPETAQPEDENTEIVVTGTHLRNASPATPVTVITREDIDRRGFNSVEDIIRSLPQTFSGFNSASHADGTAPRNSDGASVANLRGLGMGATLILVNGRRTAASPAENLTYTDISTIPFGAIERVEIMPDGGGAVYGADAVAGVINFILKRDYSGAETRVRYENSSAAADNRSFDQLFGANWRGGNFTASARYEKADPSTPGDVGISSLDFRGRGGHDWRNAQINALSHTFNNSVSIPGAPAGTALGVLPAGDGVGLTAADLIYVSQADLDAQTGSYDQARPSSSGISNSLTPQSTIWSGNFSVRQDLTDALQAHLEGSYSRRETRVRDGGYSIGPVTVPVTNTNNGFGQPVRLSYDFTGEIGLGDMPLPLNRTSATRYSANAGLSMEMARGWRAELNVTYSKDATNGTRRFVNWYGSDSDGAGADSYAAFQTALAGDLNLFGDGTAQVSPQTLAAMVYSQPAGERTSDTGEAEISFNGALWTLPGGEVTAAGGLVYRDEKLDERHYNPAPFSFEGLLGVEGPDFVPKRDMKAAYAELGIPLVGPGQRVPGIQRLQLTLQGRHERYGITGPFGAVGVDFTDFSFTFPGMSTVNYSKFSPKLGIAWNPVERLKIRSTWGKGFQSPTLPELFYPVVPNLTVGLDPLSGTTGYVAQFYGGNPHLKPQNSDTLTAGFDYRPEFVPGLSVSLTWQVTHFNDQIGMPVNSLGNLVYTNPELFPDLVTTTDMFADITGGPVTAINFLFANVGDETSRVVDFDVKYDFSTAAGRFTAGLMGTYNQELTLFLFSGLRDQLPPEVTSVFTQRLVATNFGPDRLKGTAYLDWSREHWSASLAVNHSSNYRDFGFAGVAGAFQPVAAGDPPLNVKGYTTVDTQVEFRPGQSGWRVGVGARNLFDQEFPFIDVPPLGADSSRVDFRRRVLYLSVAKAFSL